MYTLHLGDCLEVLQTLPDNSVDSVVCDPPYMIGFMGKSFDTAKDNIAASVDFWKEVYRVMRPGSHLLAFGGTRTYHRMTCAIEDAGFEIRDCIQWLYGSGFPKSHNLDKTGKFCSCNTDSFEVSLLNDSTPSPEYDMRPMRSTDLSPPLNTRDECGEVLQSCLSEQGTPQRGDDSARSGQEGRGELCLEGRGDFQAQQGQLYRPEVYSLPDTLHSNGTGGWLRDGASPDNVADGRSSSGAGGSGSPFGSHDAKQRPDESGIVAQQSEPQGSGAWSLCSRCGKPMVPPGLGTALKPAYEPIVLARKPLAERNVASNVAKYRTGALNIDATRIAFLNENDKWTPGNGGVVYRGYMDGSGQKYNGAEHEPTKNTATPSKQGRWPANILLSHHESCRQIGTRRVKAPIINRFDDGAKPFGDGAGHPYASVQTGDTEGMEAQPVWECHAECPVAMLDAQSGIVSGGGRSPSADRVSTDTYGANRTHGSAKHATHRASASHYFKTFYGDEEWQCHEDCAVRLLDEQTGPIISRNGATIKRESIGFGANGSPTLGNGYSGETSGASRFFKTFYGDEEWECHADCAMRLLDEQTGTLTSGYMAGSYKASSEQAVNYGSPEPAYRETYGDKGGASRFFYCAKASTKERNAGLGGIAALKLRDDLSTEERSSILLELQGLGVVV